LLQIVQAYDRRPIAEVETEGADALEAKLELAARSLRDRDQWLKPHERIEVLYRLASLMEPLRERFSRLIAQEGGKPLVDAGVEANRAIDGVRNAAEELRNFAGREIPMGLTAASIAHAFYAVTGTLGQALRKRGRFDTGDEGQAAWERGIALSHGGCRHGTV
jgi:acyl-CoA reductase-like NAD-dependent aldehyde dehydrogenase